MIHRTGNNIIPKGPDYDWNSPHNRNKIKFEPLLTDQHTDIELVSTSNGVAKSIIVATWVLIASRSIYSLFK